MEGVPKIISEPVEILKETSGHVVDGALKLTKSLIVNAVTGAINFALSLPTIPVVTKK